jgi:hypothetical protein
VKLKSRSTRPKRRDASRRNYLSTNENRERTRQQLGISLYRRKQFSSALEILDDARHLCELDKYGMELLIQLYLLLGEYRKGWEFFGECCRNNMFALPLSRYSLTRWGGQPLDGKRVVVWTGGGLGDQILYVRYLPRLADLRAEVVLDCPHCLVDLFRSIRGVHRVDNFHSALANADFQLTTAELPIYFGGRDGCLWPEPGPYLHVEASSIRDGGLRVGLVWAASNGHSGGVERTASLADMAPLGRVPRARFYNLQVGPAATELESPPAGMTVLPLSVGYPTFAEQARQIQGLDLVITVDTAVANLAGALGARTWVAVPEIPNWRWGLTGASTAWYPSVRIYRQPSSGDWHSVFASMARDLSAVQIQ